MDEAAGFSDSAEVSQLLNFRAISIVDVCSISYRLALSAQASDHAYFNAGSRGASGELFLGSVAVGTPNRQTAAHRGERTLC